MVDGNEGSPLAARGNVGGAKIVNDGHTEFRRQRPAIAKLHRQPPLGRVENRLAVKADEIERRGGIRPPPLFDGERSARR